MMIFTTEYKVNTKTKRLKELRRSSYKDSIPSSYKSNSLKEELCFEYINRFSEEYKTMQPHRKPLFFLAENEVGVKKFVCTTIKPSQIPYHEFYDLYELAEFMSTFMQYEPLDPPFVTPRVLCSPSYTFENYTGDSFEISNLMCSFLLGAGYDAYVVNGYAPKSITLKDQTKMLYPVKVLEATAGQSMENIARKLESKMRQQNDENNCSNKENIANGSEFSYNVISNFVKDSVFLKSVAEKQALSQQDDFELWTPAIIPDPDKREEENVPRLSGLSVIHGKHLNKGRPSTGKDRHKQQSDLNVYMNPERRVHAWVLVRAGRRGLRQDVFVEPSTGKVFQCSDSPYFGIESVWNNVNYWINSRPFEPVNRMDFDITNANNWESLFIDAKSSVRNKFRRGGGSDDLGSNKENAENNTLDDQGASSDTAGKDEDFSTGALVRLMDAPPTWVVPITLDRPRYLLRYPPSGHKSINYFCAKVDYFAKFSHSQCTVAKLTVFLDEMCTIVKEIHEIFEGRKDKMFKRSRYYVGKKYFVEYYMPGSKDEVKQWTEYPGKTIEIDFHVDGRLDRMTKRKDLVGISSVEYFAGRADHLISRTSFLTIHRSPDLMHSRLSLPGYGLLSDLYITQIDLEYERNPLIVPGSEIRKRIFYISEGKLVTQNHFAEDKVTGTITTVFHTKLPGSVQPSELSLSQEEGLVKDNLPMQQAAALLERETYNNVKLAHQQLRNLQVYKTMFEYNIESERTIFEFALDKADKDEPVVPLDSKALKPNTKMMAIPAGKSSTLPGSLTADSDKKGVAVTLSVDYLLPYLRHVKDPNNLTREEALEIRINCLDGCKARLVERANIIHARLNDENAKLGRRQEHFQRSQRDGEISTEQYEKYCTEAMFRIQILEQRLVVHEEMALKKYAELDSKLASDSRLKILRL